MNILLVTYELDNYQNDYSKISEKIKSYDGWAKPFNRTWLIRTSKGASAVRDDLSRVIDGNGKILVVNITGSAWGSCNVSSNVNGWLHQNL